NVYRMRAIQVHAPEGRNVYRMLAIERSRNKVSLHIELPDKLAGELHQLVQSGLFQSADEAIRLAPVEFLRRHQAMLTERFQREDIAWALSQKGNSCLFQT
ncbi:MAG: hypothetical protein J2P31_21050, partial [Blastocatellia bacterium]|nr:hypothetical protein [Blastocatellia bacterium]